MSWLQRHNTASCSQADDDDGWGEDSVTDDVLDALTMRDQVIDGFSQQLNKSPSSDDNSPWLHLHHSLSLPPSPPRMPAQTPTTPAPPPPPPAPPAPPASTVHTQPSTQPLASYIAQAPPGLYLYAEPTIRHPYYHQTYLPEEVFNQHSKLGMHSQITAATPTYFTLSPAVSMSQIPNPFSSAYGVPPPPPVCNLRKMAAAARQRDKEGRFVSHEEVDKKKKEKKKLKKAERESQVVASLQLQLAKATEESSRLRKQLALTQSELVELKLSQVETPNTNANNKRLRPNRGFARRELSDIIDDGEAW